MGQVIKTKKLLEDCGAVLDHIGILSSNFDAAASFLSTLPYVGAFSSHYCSFSADVLTVGVPYSLRIGFAEIRNNPIRLEILQPIKEECAPGCIYTELIRKHGDGLSHLCYKLSDENVFNKMVDLFVEAGEKVILRGRVEKQGDMEGNAFVYFEPQNGCNCYLEFLVSPLK